MNQAVLQTARLTLRRWRPSDLEPFVRMNADPQVMTHFPRCYSREESLQAYDRIQQHFAEHGYGLWAVEREGEWIGSVGLLSRTRLDFNCPVAPCVEVGWRLRAAHWGQGYATEAAREALRFGFTVCQLEEIVSFTVPGNRASRRVMEKIGLVHDLEGDFEHPNLPHAHPLRPHVLYRLSRSQWVEGAS